MDLPFVATGRDAQMRSLFKKGKATSKEILAIEYGQFPPKGLDYEPTNHLDRKVHFSTPWKDPKSGWLTKSLTSVAALGYVHGKENFVGSSLERNKPDETIFMNTALMGTLAKLAMGFLTVSLVKQLVANLTLAGIGSFLYKHELLAATALLTPLREATLTQIAGHPFRSFSDVLGHEHVHVLQIHDGKRARTGFDMDDDHFKKSILAGQKNFPAWKRAVIKAGDIISFGSTRYLLNDVEVQARLHTVMVHGYHRWGRLPRTSAEFIAGCVDAGLNVTNDEKEIIGTLPQSTQEIFLKPGLKESFERAARGVMDVNAAELNAAQRRLGSADLKKDFWQIEMPYMYGHLLELYGDPDGRAKMGFREEKDTDFGEVIDHVRHMPTTTAPQNVREYAFA